jgi:hypothetical protein
VQTYGLVHETLFFILQRFLYVLFVVLDKY